MDRQSKSQIAHRSLGNRASPMLALVIPAVLAGATFATYEVAAAAAPQTSEAQIAKAEAALKKGHAAKAIPFAEAAVAADPLNADYRALLGAAYLGAGRFMAAATSFEDALDLGQEDARTILSYALAKTAIGDSRVAVATLDEAREQLSAADYGLALALAGEAQRGVQVLIQAVRFEEVTPKLRQNLAYAYALSGNWRAARVMAAEDVPAGQIDARMVEWAATAGADQSQQRVAALLKVTPSYDMGQPAHLALANFRGGPALAVAEPVIEDKPETLRQSEALAYGLADIPAATQIERVDPTPTRPAFAERAPAAPTTASEGAVRFVSNPVVQALPRAGSRPAPTPQRRMAATSVASAEPAPRAATSDTSLDSHASLRALPIKRGVIGCRRHLAAIDDPRRFRVDNGNICLHSRYELTCDDAQQRAGLRATRSKARGRSITPSRTSVSTMASSVSAPAMPGAASAKGRRLSSGPRGSWPLAMTSIVPSAMAAITACRSASGRKGGERRESAEIGRREIRQHEMRRRNPQVTGSPRALARAPDRSPARVVTWRICSRAPCQFGQRDVAGDRQRLGLGRRARQAQPGGHLACGGRCLAGQPAILGMGHDHQIEHRGILQQPQHHARIGDPAARWQWPARPHPASARFRPVPALRAAVAPASGCTQKIGLAAFGDANCTRLGWSSGGD
jgi:tetratricopeptide (TPR) repeat protein